MKSFRVSMLEFREYEGAAYTAYLNQMAEKGWLLKSLGAGMMWFERGIPGSRRYLAVAMPGVSVFDGESSWEAKRFRESYENAGWKLQCSRVIWQIFSRDAGCVEPGDNQEEAWKSGTESGQILAQKAAVSTGRHLDELRQLKATSLSRGRIAVAVLNVCLLAWMIWMQLDNPGQALASKRVLLNMLVLLAIMPMVPVRMISTACWYRRAERRMREGGTFPEPELGKIRMRNRCGMCYLALVFGLILLTFGSSYSGSMRAVGFVATLAFVVVIFSVSSLLMWWIREYSTGDRREKIIGYGVGAVVISMMVMMVMTGILMRFEPTEPEETMYQRQGEFPVEFAELGFEPEEDWYRESSRTVLGLYQREVGVRIGEDGQEEHLVLEYYENRIPAVITRTLREYPRSGGDFWSVQEEILYQEGEKRAVHYQYRRKGDVEPELADEVNPRRDVYVISDRNRILMAAFENGAGEEDKKLFTNPESVLYLSRKIK